VNMVLPYEEANMEGCKFCLQWLSMVFRVKIKAWLASPAKTIHSCVIDSNYNQTIHILSLKKYTTHIHYEPFLGDNGSSGLTVHVTQTTSNFHTRGMLFSQNESPLSCNMGKQGLNKKKHA
jgi:hypothetical protein